MSLPQANLVQQDDKLFLAGINSTGLESLWTENEINELTSEERVADWNSDVLTNLTNLNQSEQIFNNSDSDSVQSRITNFLIDSTTKFAQNLHDLATEDNRNISEPEVTIRRPEVGVNDGGIGTAEKVVIGAAGIVACMAVIALILRFIGPRCRSKSSDTLTDEEKAIPDETVISKLSGFSNLGSDISSTSSGLENTSSQDCSQSTGSTPVTDWSDISGDRIKSSSGSGSGSSSGESEEIMTGKTPHYTKLSKTAQKTGRYHAAMFSSDDRLSARSSPGVRRKVPDENISVISTQSLEPLRLGQNYRDNWDDQFDPTCSVPRGNLSHLSHPSESRLSLNSLSSGSSSTTFPIPSRDIVRQMHKDKERRYPSNTTLVKKEKHVRLSPENDGKDGTK
ncbi:hypothetical protein ACF0H5_024520 [Mactra antiquata]